MISRIELTNYQPYLGDHAVDLQEGVTLIEASYDDDDRASNRGGKSALLEAIPFAMAVGVGMSPAGAMCPRE